ERRYMNIESLDIERYGLGLMAPEDRSAFEQALSESSVLQKDFADAGNALSNMFVRLAEGTPAPDDDVKGMILAAIREPAGFDHPEVLEGPVVALTPGIISEAQPYAAGTGTTRSLGKRITLLL